VGLGREITTGDKILVLVLCLIIIIINDKTKRK